MHTENRQFVKNALSLGIPLHVVEEYLDWLENCPELASKRPAFWTWLSEVKIRRPEPLLGNLAHRSPPQS